METNLTYDMYVPTRVMFGAGMLNKLSEQPMPGKRALIVISNGKCSGCEPQTDGISTFLSGNRAGFRIFASGDRDAGRGGSCNIAEQGGRHFLCK